MAGINYQTFVTWRRKHGVGSSAREQQQARPVTFVEAVISAGPGEESAAGSTAVLVIELSSGVMLRFQCAAHIPLTVQLLNALQQPRSC
jgi:hypothetical protein